ncbi:MAG: hypothetical protein HDT43_09920 [Ruminococcaceae bacterium]|nr:hypothetical protein [Oscillospiraceae bacterium]
MKNFPRFVTLMAALICAVVLGSCGEVEENYCPDLYDLESDETEETESFEPPVSAASEVSGADTAARVGVSYSETDLVFTVEDIFSEGEYYSVSVVGEKPADSARTDVNGERNFRLVLEKDGAEIGSLGIEVAEGDRFLIMESVLDGLSYGCTVISNKREFSVDGYPDIIQLDFYRDSELVIPQYGRFFAVFDGRLEELPVYENGVETEPCGTYLELRGEGRMVQHLCVFTHSGKSLMVEKFEYIFDTEKRRLEKREVRFLGWNVDN